MLAFAINKDPEEKFDIGISHINENPVISYAVDHIVSCTAIRRSDSSDQSSSILDAGMQGVSGNKSIIWVQNGVIGEIYDIYLLSVMTTGQKFLAQIELTIRRDS